MPKINVYLPDELAAAVKAADLPVSAICQKALTDAVEAVGTARRAVAALRDPAFDPDGHPAFAERLTARMTAKLHRSLDLAREAAPAAGPVTTAHLLIGVLDERANLAVRLLETLAVDRDGLRDAAGAVSVDEQAATSAAPAAPPDAPASLWSGLTVPARAAIGAALEASIDLGHNYLGCEHLLLGLLADGDSGAGIVLHEAALDTATVQRAVTTAIAGFVHARRNAPPADASGLAQVLQRLDSIERRLSALEV
ncbi:MAG: ATP-dependent Clp protease ATP-binding subunit [Catenulispora sp.]|nr:ATP-dependent Clp protease ATP-binding subunit [Catenulispora sp.]